MSTIIAVPVDWTIYEVEDDLVVYLNSAVQILPPYMILESLVLSGKAKRVITETVRDSDTTTSPWYPDEEQSESEDNEDE
jgi:hypothetical protein